MLRYASFFNFSSSFLFYTSSEDFHQAASSIPQDRLAHLRDVVALSILQYRVATHFAIVRSSRGCREMY
ncbi:MAG TPA: hypothetical protein VMW50_07660, partial [Dehalococcoidia bacterium]|nr:hypothetical protein [Dehalococcoidia bacterium]